MYKAVIAYDGTQYFGWQKTKTGPSIQEELEKAIRQITGETVLFEAASRTDRGVHARGQVVQFGLQKERASDKLLLGLNAVLPSDIRVIELEPKVFHPTLDADGKEYHYRICTESAQNPILRLYSWHFPYSLNLEAIQEGISYLLGTHDFSALANEDKNDPVCTLAAIEFDGKEFRIQGNRFLYKMVRNLVGLLVYVGVGKIEVDKVPHILKSKDRKLAGVTAPAHGLYLHQVFYGIKYTESDSKIGKCQGGAPLLSQAQPTPKQTNLEGWCSGSPKTHRLWGGVQADLKSGGCPTRAEPIFESRAV